MPDRVGLKEAASAVLGEAEKMREAHQHVTDTGTSETVETGEIKVEVSEQDPKTRGGTRVKPLKPIDSIA